MLAPGRYYEQNATLVRRAKVEKALLAAGYFRSSVEGIVQNDLFRLLGPHFVPGHMT
jgi:hypothetical protein